MPRMDTPSPRKALVKMLIIGDGKIGKTHYAGMAAQEGLNVLYMDGDVGSQTIATLPMEARKHIYLLGVADTMGGGIRDHRFCDVFSEFTSRTKMRWNDTDQQIGKRTDKNVETWEIQPAKMDHNTLFVLDSWTSLCESIMTKCAMQNGVDLATASTTEMRPVYQAAALMATSFLQVIRSMPCHVIVIAHPDEFSHMTKPEGRKAGDINEKDMVVDWTKMIPKSTSKPQGLIMAKYFTDVAWAEMNPAGNERRLNFKVKADRVSGGHFDGTKAMDKEHSFANLVKEIGGTLPAQHQPVDSWLTISDASEEEPEAPTKVLDGTKSSPVKGLASLVKKQS